MPTREEIALLLSEHLYADTSENSERAMTWASLHKPAQHMFLITADAILALPSPAPVGEAALLARAEAAEAALKERDHELDCLQHQVQELAYPCSPHCQGYLRELQLRRGCPSRVAAQQTAAAEAREEGR